MIFQQKVQNQIAMVKSLHAKRDQINLSLWGKDLKQRLITLKLLKNILSIKNKSKLNKFKFNPHLMRVRVLKKYLIFKISKLFCRIIYLSKLIKKFFNNKLNNINWFWQNMMK